MLILGLAPVKKLGQQVKRHHCPRCGGERNFQEITIRQYFTLFFIPVFPIAKPTRLYACSACNYALAEEQLNAESLAAETGAAETNPAGQVIVFCPRCEGAMTVPLTERRQALTCPHCAMEFKIKGIKGVIPAATITEPTPTV